MKPGDRVTILNQKYSGRVFVEGEATFVEMVPDIDGYAIVQIDGDSTVSERYIDPNAQGLTADELETYVNNANEEK